MGRRAVTREAIIDILRDHGPLTSHGVTDYMRERDFWTGESVNVVMSRVKSALQRMRVEGYIRRNDDNEYVVVEDSKEDHKPARRAAEIDYSAVVGVPDLGDVDADLIRAALRSLLVAGQTLADVLDHTTPGSALEEFLTGALRAQSAHGAMLRLVLERAEE